MLPRICIMVLVATLLNGCGAVDMMRKLVLGDPARTGLASIRIVAEPDANQNMATALDIVFVYDAGIVDMLPKSGLDWFARKTELTRGMPTTLDVVSFQIPPSFEVPKVNLPKRYDDAIRVVVYANYLSKDGQVPGNLTRLKRAVIRLGRESIAYVNS